MGRNERFPEFCCRTCGSPGIRIDGPLEPNAMVRCGRCEADLGDWGSFVEAAEALLGQNLTDRLVRREAVAEPKLRLEPSARKKGPREAIGAIESFAKIDDLGRHRPGG